MSTSLDDLLYRHCKMNDYGISLMRYTLTKETLNVHKGYQKVIFSVRRTFVLLWKEVSCVAMIHPTFIPTTTSTKQSPFSFHNFDGSSDHFVTVFVPLSTPISYRLQWTKSTKNVSFSSELNTREMIFLGGNF